MEQLAIVATLREGAAEEARRLIELGPPFDAGAHGFSRHSVFLSEHEVVFVFAAPEVEGALQGLVSDESSWVVQGTLEAWQPLIDGEVRTAQLAFSWERQEHAADAPPPE